MNITINYIKRFLAQYSLSVSPTSIMYCTSRMLQLEMEYGTEEGIVSRSSACTSDE